MLTDYCRVARATNQSEIHACLWSCQLGKIRAIYPRASNRSPKNRELKQRSGIETHPLHSTMLGGGEVCKMLVQIYSVSSPEHDFEQVPQFPRKLLRNTVKFRWKFQKKVRVIESRSCIAPSFANAIVDLDIDFYGKVTMMLRF